jgi:sulfite exporter TauE/SafE
MTDALPALGAALMTGFLGSAHCIGMCAGISGLFAVQTGVMSLRARLPMALAYNAGRVISYAVLGLIVATLGSGAVAAVPSLAGPVRFVGGLVIVLIGLQIAFDWRVLRPIERTGSRLWARLAPAARRLLPVTSLPRALGLGLLWGWLPCGLVYSVLLLAATTARPLGGALTMLAFGIGTLPAMLATGMGAARLGALLSRRRARLGLGLLIVILGGLTLAMPALGLLGPGAQHH